MNGYLADTHVVLWAMSRDPRLRPAQREALESGERVHVSIVSLWEVAIKLSLGKLTFAADFREEVARRNVTLLPITPDHTDAVARLPLLHRDPFDRMLVAQAQVEGLTLLSADPNVRAYPVPSL